MNLAIGVALYRVFTWIVRSRFQFTPPSYPNGIEALIHCFRAGKMSVVNMDEYISLTYRKISIISRTKSQNLNVSRLGLQLSLHNILKPSVKWRMEMWLEQRRQAMLQLHLSDQQFDCLSKCVLYWRLDGIWGKDENRIFAGNIYIISP